MQKASEEDPKAANGGTATHFASDLNKKQPEDSRFCNLNQEYLAASTQLTPRRVPQARTQLADGKSRKIAYPDPEILLLHI